MKTFLQRFGGVVLGILNGFDRVVFKGKLRQLYCPDGMNRYHLGLSAYGLLRRQTLVGRRCACPTLHWDGPVAANRFCRSAARGGVPNSRWLAA